MTEKTAQIRALAPSITANGVPRRHVLGLLVGSAVGLVACGGGGDQIAGISSGGTGSFVSGTIIGFGSVIVNNVRYDDSQAEVFGVDGDNYTGLGALKLGMVVAVQGGATAASITGLTYTAEAKADAVVFLTELLGPVSNVDSATQTFELLGQVVHWSATTIFDGLGSSAGALSAGQIAEVYGFWDGTLGQWQATRVETTQTQPARYRLSGTVSELDRVNRTMRIGDQVVTYAQSLSVDARIANGSRVRARLEPQVGSTLQAIELRLADWQALTGLDWANVDDHDMELEGVVLSVNGTQFELQGVTVDGSGLLNLPQVGQRIEVKGVWRNGVLVASQTELEGEQERESKGFELHGVVSESTSNTFMLRGFLVTHDAQTMGRSLIVNGNYIEAKLRLQADGSWLALDVEAEYETPSSSSNDHEGDDSHSESDDD